MNCPHCGANVDIGAKFCKICGESLLDTAPVYTAPAPEPQPQPQPEPKAEPQPAPSYVNKIVLNGEIPPQYKPLRGWAYFGLSVLYSIPIIGFIFLLVFTFSNKNINRRNHARSYWCALLVFLIIGIILSVLLIIAMNANGLTFQDLIDNIVDSLYY